MDVHASCQFTVRANITRSATTPTAGQQTRLLSLSFGTRSTGTGPQAYAVYTSVDNYAAPIASGAIANNSVWVLIAPSLTPLVAPVNAAVTVRIFGYNGTGSPGAGTANWRIDDLKLGVTVALAAPVITTQPQAQAVLAGTPVTLTVAAAASTATPTYQWRKGGVAIAGATNASLALGLALVEFAGSYDVVITNSAGTTTSAAVTLAVTKVPITFAFANLTQTYDGTPRVVTVTSNPPFVGLRVTYTSSAVPPRTMPLRLSA